MQIDALGVDLERHGLKRGPHSRKILPGHRQHAVADVRQLLVLAFRSSARSAVRMLAEDELAVYLTDESR